MKRSSLSKSVICAAIVAVSAFAQQYKAESAGASPSNLPPGMAQVLQKEGTKITGPNGTVCEIWLVSTAPKGPASGEENVTLPTIPHGSLLGVIRFPSQGSDRRGQVIKPGVYTLRYSMFPINGDHQGVAPQRDFFVLSRIEDDKDASAKPNFDALMAFSRKASGTQHPLVMSIWKADDQNQTFAQQGDDWVLQRKMGDTNLAIIVIGKASA